MKNKIGKLTGQLLLSVCLMGLYSVKIQAQTAPSDSNVEQTLPLIALNITQEFEPRPSSTRRLDFGNWSHFLSNVVLNMGPAVRVRAPRVRVSGTRIVKRDSSAYRLEGNKVIYTLMRDNEKKWLKEYVRDLEILSTEIDITTLPKDDQLSYWYNLHNAAVISLIANNYPVRFPEDLTPLLDSEDTLHDAKILNIAGVPLSLRDIREKIVYPNWKNPLVIYGFHHGKLGGPSIALQAYEHNTLSYLLNLNANEFINSFRGYRIGKISLLYKAASPFYFPNGEEDIRAHFKRYMRPEVYKSVELYESLRWHKSLPQTADVSGGVGYRSSPVVVNFLNRGASSGLPIAFSEVFKAREVRFRVARKRGLLKGDVTIDDLDSDAPVN